MAANNNLHPGPSQFACTSSQTATGLFSTLPVILPPVSLQDLPPSDIGLWTERPAARNCRVRWSSTPSKMPRRIRYCCTGPRSITASRVRCAWILPSEMLSAAYTPGAVHCKERGSKGPGRVSTHTGPRPISEKLYRGYRKKYKAASSRAKRLEGKEQQGGGQVSDSSVHGCMVWSSYEQNCYAL
jgi:hypothetical protein